MASCSIITNKEDGRIIKVMAPNRKQSILYQNALDALGDEQLALRVWARAYTPSFKLRYGDWEKEHTNLKLDINGEPLLATLMNLQSGVNRIIESEYSQCYSFQPGREKWAEMRYVHAFIKQINKKYPDIVFTIKTDPNRPGMGLPVVVPTVKSISTSFTKSEIEKQKVPVNKFMDRLINKFPGLTYEWIKPSDLKQNQHQRDVSVIRSFVKDNKIYLVEGRVTPEDGIEEIMHVFIEMVRQSKPNLFKGLFENTYQDEKYAADYLLIKEWYASKDGEYDQNEVKSEFLAKAMAKGMRTELEENPNGRPTSVFGKLLSRFLDWLADILGTESIRPGQAIKDIIQYINSEDVILPLPEDSYMYYSIDPPAGSNVDPDSKDDAAKMSPRFKGKTARELNIEKITEGLEDLKVLKTAVTSLGARNVIDAIIKNNEEVLDALRNDEAYVSTTIYKGSQDSESSENKATQLGANTGNFFHDLMQKIQIDAIMNKKSAIDIFYQDNYFEEFLENNKKSILFDKYDPAMLKSMGGQVASMIQGLMIEGKVALPETTIGVKDVDGTLVLGRLDVMAVDRNGITEVIDLKTKLNKGPATNIFPEQLFNRPFDFRGDYKDGVASEFMEFRNKSDLDNYHIQLAIYSEMLKKLGIKVNENGHQIFALAFSTTISPDGTKFELNGFNTKKYTYPNLISNNNIKQFTAINGAAQSRFDPEAGNKILTEEEQVISEKENPFGALSDDSKNNLIQKLSELAEQQIESLQKEIVRVQENEQMDFDKKAETESRLRRQIASILEIKLKLGNIFESTQNYTEETLSLAKAAIIKLALDTFQKEIENIDERIKALDVPKTFNIKNLEDTYVLKELQQNTEALDNIAEYLNLFVGTITAMDIDGDVKLTITDYLNKSINKANNISNAYVSVGKNVMKAVLMESIGQKKFEAVFGDMRRVLGPKLEWINKMINRMEAGDAATDPFFFKVGRVINNFFAINKSNADRLEALKKEKAEIESLMKMNTLNDETLDAYLEGIINNPDSAFYMGSTIAGNNPIISMDAIIGSNANSEMAISGLFQYMRNTLEEAKNEGRNWAYETDVDGEINKFVSSAGGSTAANKMISEEVVVNEKFDKDGNVSKEQSQRQYLSPMMQEYENTSNMYKGRMRVIGDSISELHTKIREEANAAAKEDLEKQRADLYKELHDLEKEFTEWQIAEQETQIKPEVLRLMKGSGKHNSQISDLYSTINEIINNAGGEEMLTDSDQDAIDELEAQVSRIRQEQLEQDPAAAALFDELMTYFEYDSNVNLWTVKREDVVKENNQAMLDRFDRNNTDIMPTEEWQDTVSDLFKQLTSILGEDSELKELNNKISNIKRKNKVRGKFNYKYMTDSDIEQYNQLIKSRDARLEFLKLNPPQLSENDQERLGIIYDTLGAIRKRELNEDYKKEKTRQENNVRNKYQLYKEAEKAYKNAASPTVELSNAVESARVQYERAEDEYAKFFNKHNDVKYPMGEDALAKKKTIKERPKAYLYEYVPTNDKYLEKVPNKKYRIRRLKSSAYNENYQASFVKDKFGRGMLPMPKGMRFNAETKTFDIDPKSRYANPEFLKMQKNTSAHEFYKKFVVENFLMKQKSASGIPLGFCFPFSEQRLGDNIVTKGVEGVAREVKEKVQELAYKNSEFEKATNESGMTGEDKVRFKENTRMPADLTTTNGIQALLEWNYGYYANKAMAKTGTQMDAVLYYLNNIRDRISVLKDDTKTERLNKIDTIIKIADFEKRKFVYGQRFEKEKEPNAFFNRKTMRMLMKLAATGRMAFDIPMQFGNLLSGNVQTYLSTCVSKHADEYDYLNAKKLVYTRWFPAMIGDWGKISDVSLETMLFRYMNPLGKDFTEELDGASTSRARKLFARGIDIQDMSMVIQDKGETEIGLTTMLMIMYNTKYEVFETDASGDPIIEDGVKKIKKDADGNTVYVNAIEAFAKKDGKLVMREDVNISQKDINDLKGTIMTEVYNFQGNYSAYTQTQFGSTLFGSLYNFYRKYLIPSLSTRFSYGDHKGVGSAYSWDTQKANVGWYVGAWRLLKYYGLGKASKTLLYDTLLPGFVKKSFKLSDEEMSTEGALFYRSRAAMAARELIFGYLALQLYWTLRASLNDSDEDDLSYAELMLMRSLVKVSNETRSLIPFPVIGKPEDYIDTFSSYTSAFKEGKILWDIAKHSWWYFNYELTGSEFAYERGFYQNDTPRFEAGTPKVVKNFSDIAGWSNIVDVFSPYEAAKTSLKSKE